MLGGAPVRVPQLKDQQISVCILAMWTGVVSCDTEQFWRYMDNGQDMSHPWHVGSSLQLRYDKSVISYLSVPDFLNKLLNFSKNYHALYMLEW